jgi:hypothetical protein
MLSLPKEFEASDINYNFEPESWSIEKLIAMFSKVFLPRGKAKLP